MEASLKMFGSQVQRLIAKENLTREESYLLFKQVLCNEQPDLQQGAFLAAITAKGATPDEIAGGWQAIYDLDTVKVSPEVDGPLVENCGTGMDSIKTFNISTAAAVVAASEGVLIAKHGARAITSRCGTVDMLEMLGIDVECDAQVVRRSIEKVGIGLFNGMSSKIHPLALGRILSQIRFGTILNIAASLANPALPTYGVRGVYSQDMILPTIQSMKAIGYSRAMVIHGLDESGTRGMDEISILGRTAVAELQEDGTILTCDLNPEDFGTAPGEEKEILCGLDREEEAIRLLRTLGGMSNGSRKEAICMNAAPILYLAGNSSDLMEGYHIAKGVVESGKAVDKLREWVKVQNTDPEIGLENLDGLLRKAEMTT